MRTRRAGSRAGGAAVAPAERNWLPIAAAAIALLSTIAIGRLQAAVQSYSAPAARVVVESR